MEKSSSDRTHRTWHATRLQEKQLELQSSILSFFIILRCVYIYIGFVGPDVFAVCRCVYIYTHMNAGCTCCIAHREELKRAYKILIGESEWKPRERHNLIGG